MLGLISFRRDGKIERTERDFIAVLSGIFDSAISKDICDIFLITLIFKNLFILDVLNVINIQIFEMKEMSFDVEIGIHR